MFNERARSLFDIAPSDLGRPIQDLKLSYRQMELRKLIDQAVESISSLMTDDEVRRKMSNAAMSRAENFGPEAFEATLANVIRRYHD